MPPEDSGARLVRDLSELSARLRNVIRETDPHADTPDLRVTLPARAFDQILRELQRELTPVADRPGGLHNVGIWRDRAYFLFGGVRYEKVVDASWR